MASRIGDEDDEEVMVQIEETVEREYPAAYPVDFQYEEAYKKAIRKGEEIEREVPRLISYLLSTMTIAAKDQVTAQPDYADTIRDEDLLKLWEILERVFARQGVYSAVSLQTQLVTLRQGKLTFDAFVCKFRELAQICQNVGADLNENTIVIQFLTSLNHEESVSWDMKISEILSTIPLPTLVKCIDILMCHRQLLKIRGETTLESNMCT